MEMMPLTRIIIAPIGLFFNRMQIPSSAMWLCAFLFARCHSWLLTFFLALLTPYANACKYIYIFQLYAF
jgi:hypothetical protein